MGRRLTQIELPSELLFQIFEAQDRTQVGADHLAGPLAAFGKQLQDFLIHHRDEESGVGVQQTTFAWKVGLSAGIENGEDDLCGEGCRGDARLCARRV